MESVSQTNELEGLFFNQGACCQEKSDHKNLSLETSIGFEKVDVPNVFLAARELSLFENRTAEFFTIVSKDLKTANSPPNSGRQVRLKTQNFRI